MPRTLHMSWVGHQRRWTKMYRGRTYSVSCRQLDVPATKDASWAAANQWWEVKQAAIDAVARAAEPPPDPTSVAVSQLLAAHGFSHYRDVLMARDRGVAAAKLLELVRMAAGEEEGPLEGLEAIHAGKPVLPPVPHEELVRIDSLLGPTPGPPAAGRTLKEHVERWIGSLRDRVAGRKMSAGRRDRYERDIRKFLAWSGPGSLVDELTAAKLDGWYSHLCEGLQEGGGTETARHAMMTVRQLVRYWFEKDQGGGEEKYRRYDCVQSAWSRLKEEVEVRLDLKHFRKTSAQLLSESARFRHLVGVFLAQAPRGVAARNYLDESRGPQFRRAVAWLGQQFGLEA